MQVFIPKSTTCQCSKLTRDDLESHVVKPVEDEGGPKADCYRTLNNRVRCLAQLLGSRELTLYLDRHSEGQKPEDFYRLFRSEKGEFERVKPCREPFSPCTGCRLV